MSGVIWEAALLIMMHFSGLAWMLVRPYHPHNFLLHSRDYPDMDAGLGFEKGTIF